MDNEAKTNLTPGRIIAAAIVGSIVLALAPMVLYPFRNAKPESVAERFVRSRSEIAGEAGEITGVGKVEARSRSEEIARRLGTGESLANITPSNASATPLVERRPDDVISLQLNVTGSKRNVDAEVTLKREYFGENYVPYYVVTGMNYRDERGDSIDVPIGRLENYFLLLK